MSSAELLDPAEYVAEEARHVDALVMADMPAPMAETQELTYQHNDGRVVSTEDLAAALGGVCPVMYELAQKDPDFANTFARVCAEGSKARQAEKVEKAEKAERAAREADSQTAEQPIQQIVTQDRPQLLNKEPAVIARKPAPEKTPDVLPAEVPVQTLVAPAIPAEAIALEVPVIVEVSPAPVREAAVSLVERTPEAPTATAPEVRAQTPLETEIAVVAQAHSATLLAPEIVVHIQRAAPEPAPTEQPIAPVPRAIALEIALPKPPETTALSIEKTEAPQLQAELPQDTAEADQPESFTVELAAPLAESAPALDAYPDLQVAVVTPEVPASIAAPEAAVAPAALQTYQELTTFVDEAISTSQLPPAETSAADRSSNETPLLDFTAFVAERPATPSTPTPTLEHITPPHNEQPLEQTFVQLAHYFAENTLPPAPDAEPAKTAIEADTQAAQEEQIRAALAAIAELLPPTVYIQTEAAAKQILTPELTQKMLELLEKLGYEMPKQALLDMVQLHGVAFLLQALQYMTRLGDLDEAREIVPAKNAPATDDSDDSLGSRIGSAVLKLLALGKTPMRLQTADLV